MAPDVHVHERPVRRVGTIEAKPAFERLVPALLREALDHRGQEAGTSDLLE
jgi:hypothetical protein